MIETSKERQAPISIELAEPSHLVRYQFAGNFIDKEQIVLDVPCGSGYGTNLMARYAKNVVGVDKDSGAIGHAKEFFSGRNIDFYKGNAEHLGEMFERKQLFDVVVSFEGIEHLEHPDVFLLEIKKVLAPEGILIISTPRKPHGSPYHTVEFSLEEFTKILNVQFKVQAMYGQIFTDIFNLSERNIDPLAYKRFNFIAVCAQR